MNWLAHIFLSEQNINFQIGNYLADPLKGRAWEGAHSEVSKGMFVHKKIDAFTDAHDIFIQSKNRVRDKGLLKPVVIDITYDYLLTKNWDKFCTIELQSFTKKFYDEAELILEYLPTEVQIPINRILRSQVLNKYQNLEQVKQAFANLDKRLSQRLLARDTASSYFDSVVNNLDALEEDFLQFFPELCSEVKSNVDHKNLLHWHTQLL